MKPAMMKRTLESLDAVVNGYRRLVCVWGGGGWGGGVGGWGGGQEGGGKKQVFGD